MRIYVMDYFGEIVTRELFPIPVNGWKLAKWVTNSNFITENFKINSNIFSTEYGQLCGCNLKVFQVHKQHNKLSLWTS